MKNSGFSYCFLRRLIIGFLFTLIFLPPRAMAQGDLMITPRRIVFEGNKNREEITLANTGQDTATYTISFVQYQMTEEGRFEEITEPLPGQMFADPYLRFFPRTVTLMPEESQVIRMQLRRSGDMAEGEYRSHIYFRATPEVRPLGEEELLADSTAIGIRLTPIFGITIPVIIRVGNTSCQVSLSNLSLETLQDTTQVLHLTINREGNQSVYGDLYVDYVAPDQEPVQIGLVRGIAVYTPNNLRRFTMNLSVPEEMTLDQGKLVVRYTSAGDVNTEEYAHSEYILP
jgi:hypothetical protein